MLSRRVALRTISAAAIAGIVGCIEKPSLGRFSKTGTDESAIPVTWKTWLHGAQFGTQLDADPLVVNLGGARPPPERLQQALLGFDPETGEQVWAVDADHGLSDVVSDDLTVSGPVVIGGSVYTVTDYGALCALDATTGDREWTVEDVVRPTGTAGNSIPQEVPVPFGEFVCVTGTASQTDGDRTTIFAFDAEDGTERWQYDLTSPVASTPVEGASSLVVPLTDGTLEAIGTDGERQWHTSAGDTSTGVAVGDETAFVGGVDETIYAIDLDDGTERWRTAVETAITTVSAHVDDALVGGTDGSLYALEGADGDVRWQRTLDNAPTKVVVAGDRLLTLTGSNGLAYEPAVDVPEKPVTLSVHDRDSGVVLNHFEYEDGRSGWLKDIVSDGERFYLARHEALSQIDEAFLDR